MSGGRALRSYLADGESRLVVGGYDAMTARLAERAGFEILYVTGYGTATAAFGLPDIGLLTMTEMVDACRRVCEAVERPVIADADTGYGGGANVRRAIRAFEGAGAAAVHIEDQTFPKRCGHMASKHVVGVDEMTHKIEVALDARRDDEFVVIARTDAVAVEGIDGALRRAEAYKAAGADVIFVDAMTSREEIERVAREIPGPLLFDWGYDGVTPHVSRRWLGELGYELVLFPDTGFAVHRTLAAFFERLADTDCLDEAADALSSFDDMNAFVGADGWLAVVDRATT